ncbi:MAG TPA: phosphatidylinositol mannoside acyltransferase [Actinomycetota bacterium]|nr:phosphatidylinositol mannoside acyltransferase [Actinomycetota bacterium]
MSRETPRERLAYWTYRGLEAVAMGLPERGGRRVFATAGALAYRRLHGVRATVRANQARVLGLDPNDERVQASTREAFDLYARYWYDTFRVRRMPAPEVHERAEMVNLERIDQALAAGHGCIAALPHMGNWDIGGHYLAVNGYAIAAVAEELRPARLSELFLRHREELGMRIIPLSKNGHVGQQLKQLLERNWVVALVADRDLTGRGIEVEMFGATRRVPAGPALLSLSTGAPLLVCPVYTTTSGWRIEIGEPLAIEPTGSTRGDVTALSRRMAAEFERAIAARPSDWHLFQAGWD